MLLTNRLFERREPGKSAKKLYVFCEGKKREYQYFQYFKAMDSKINILVYPLESHQNNSPTGLYTIATDQLLRSENNPDPPYEFIEGDEVWFVIDTDKWGGKIPELRSCCGKHKDWKIAQSNPCFEVWLHFHLFEALPNFDWLEICEEWKSFLNERETGGFDSRKHPILIKTAIDNARNHYQELDDQPKLGTTAVFQLAEIIYGVCGRRIENKLNRI